MTNHYFPDVDAIPIESLFDVDGINPNRSADPRAALQAAEIIIGRDVMTGNEFIVYGRGTLAKIVRTKKTRGCQALVIGLDQDSKELEKLLALMNVVKGKHDYRAA